MAVFAIWESYYGSDAAADGKRVTEAIWRDMPGFDGYLRHQIVEDLDDPGHLFVISEWADRAAADQARDQYRDAEHARRADALVSQPRRRTLARRIREE